jgi:hypothetical protein
MVSVSVVTPAGNPSNDTFRSPPQSARLALTNSAIRLPCGTDSVCARPRPDGHLIVLKIVLPGDECPEVRDGRLRVHWIPTRVLKRVFDGLKRGLTRPERILVAAQPNGASGWCLCGSVGRLILQAAELAHPCLAPARRGGRSECGTRPGPACQCVQKRAA